MKKALSFRVMSQRTSKKAFLPEGVGQCHASVMQMVMNGGKW
jgi:hypothetical protein